MIAKQFKVFTKATSEFYKHPKKFRGKPKLSGYKRKYRTFYIGRNGDPIQNYQLMITGGEVIGFLPMKALCCEHQAFNAKAHEAVVSDLR